MRALQGLAALFALGTCALAGPARGEDAVAAAKRSFTEGLASMQAGDFEKGCPAIEASYKLDPRPGTLFTLAECEAKRGRLSTAVARYEDYLSLYSRLPEEQRRKQGDREATALRQRDALRPQTPELTLRLPPDAPKGTVVTLNGNDVEPEKLGLPLRVDPGEHVVTTQAPGGSVTEIKVSIGKGEKRPIFLDVAALDPAPQAKAPRASADLGLSGRRIAAYAAGGVGVGGLILGGVMGVMTLEKKGEIEENCGFIPGDPRGCNDVGLEAASDAQFRGLVSTIGFAIGGAGVAAAVVLLVTEPKAAPAAPQGVQVGLLSTGPDHFMFGLRGAW